MFSVIVLCIAFVSATPFYYPDGTVGNTPTEPRDVSSSGSTDTKVPHIAVPGKGAL